MTREALISHMKDNAGTAVDFAREFNRSQAAIEEDLEHIRTSLRNDPDNQLLIRPAKCLLCGFIFSSDKAKAPTKCPECQEQKIAPPSFKIGPR